MLNSLPLMIVAGGFRMHVFNERTKAISVNVAVVYLCQRMKLFDN